MNVCFIFYQLLDCPKSKFRATVGERSHSCKVQHYDQYSLEPLDVVGSVNLAKQKVGIERRTFQS